MTQTATDTAADDKKTSAAASKNTASTRAPKSAEKKDAEKKDQPSAAEKDAQTESPAPAAKTPAANKDERLRIRAKAAQGFWRAGRKFTQELQEFVLSDFSADQLVALEAEPELIIERI